jgi:hypothetical protein
MQKRTVLLNLAFKVLTVNAVLKALAVKKKKD